VKTLFAALLVVLMVPLVAAAQDCIYYDEYLRWVGRLLSLDSSEGVVIEGTYAYVADGYGGLLISRRS